MTDPTARSPLDDARTALRGQGSVVRAVRLRLLCWQAWAPGLLNPRHGLTRQSAERRVQADLDHEWRTGRVARAQRTVRRVAR